MHQVAQLVVALSATSGNKLRLQRHVWEPILLPMVRCRLRRFRSTDLARVLSGLCVRLGCQIGNERVVRKILLPACAMALDGCTRPSELTDMALGLAMHTSLQDRNHFKGPGERWRKCFWERAEAVSLTCSDASEVHMLREAGMKLLGQDPET